MHYPNPTLGKSTTPAHLNYMCSGFQNYMTP
jgi:hypothetical protein